MDICLDLAFLFFFFLEGGLVLFDFNASENLFYFEDQTHFPKKP